LNKRAKIPKNYTFVSNEYVTIHWQDQGAAYNNSYASRIWHVENVPLLPEQTLSPTEMNEFLNHALYLAQYYKPAGKMIEFIWVEWQQHTYKDWHNQDKADRWHHINVLYGIPNN